MKYTLKEITELLSELTAFEYANVKLEQERLHSTVTVLNTNSGTVTEKKVPYLEFMKATWGHETDNLDTCIERSRIAKLDEYSKAIELYTGFIKNGKVFVLNKQEKFVSFLYKQDKKDDDIKKSHLYTHYNPLKVDCIEQCIKSDFLFQRMEDRYDLSNDENEMISECDKLISSK